MRCFRLMEERRYKNKVFLTVCLIVMLLSVVLSIGSPSMAFADSSTTSSVLEDLRQDESFDIGHYPINNKDYSIKVIQVAESVDGFLLIYTYQPSNNKEPLDVTKVNMSLSQEVGDTTLYDLTLLSRNGVFSKYKVEGLTVGSQSIRYYNITSVYRDWVASIDKPADNDNTVNGVAYSVGQLWSARSVSGNVVYDMSETEVIVITEQMIGSRRYYDGFRWENSPSCDSHFLAFSCDHSIDKLLSAKIEFDTNEYKEFKGGLFTKDSYEISDAVHHIVNLYDYQVASNDGSGWFGEYKEWHRMSSMTDFIKEVGIEGDDKKMLEQYDWILNFYESSYVCEFGGKDFIIALFSSWAAIRDARTSRFEKVSNVSLLRLSFEYDGQIYDLGVVSNTQTGSNKPMNGNGSFDLLAWLEEKTGIPKGVWIAGVVLIILAILMPILSAVFPAFGQVLKTVFEVLCNALKSLIKGLGIVLKYFFKALWWLICLPFKGLKALITKIKDR